MSHLTIAEISTKTGISKQRLYRFLNQNSINPSIKKSNKSFYSEAVQTLIYQHFKGDIQENQSTTRNTDDTNYHDKQLNNNDKEGSIAIQTMLIKEINIKNKEIENLQDLLKENQKLLDQQQQLTLQANKQIEKLQEQILLLAPEKEDDPEETIGDQSQMIAKFRKIEEPQKENVEHKETAFFIEHKKWCNFGSDLGGRASHG